MDRKIDVIEGLEGKKTVVLQDIIFKGKRSINWDDVEKYLRKYINEIYLSAFFMRRKRTKVFTLKT